MFDCKLAYVLAMATSFYGLQARAQDIPPKPLLSSNGPNSALEDVVQRIRFCAVSTDNKTRLECYDELSKFYHVKPDEEKAIEAQPTSRGTAQFAWTKTSDNPDDKTVALQADDATIEGMPLSKPKVVLAVRCSNRILQVFLVFDSEANPKTSSVSLKVDSYLYKGDWQASLSGKSVGLWAGREAVQVGEMLAKSDKINLHVPIQQGSLIAYFNSIDSSQVLAPIVKECNTSPKKN